MESTDATPDTPTTDAPDTTPDVPDATAQPSATAPTMESQMTELLQAQHDQRAEMAALRQELAQAKQTTVTGPSPTVQSASDLQQARLDELAQHDYYCPACGKVASYQRECTGRGEAPHPPVEVVPTDEVKNAPDPNSDPQGYREWQSSHTAAPATGV